MKRCFIIFGWDNESSDCWYPWLKEKLEEKGFTVEIPEMPDSEEPRIGPWVSKLKEVVGNVDEETYFVGHSVGCQTILRFLQTFSENTKVGKVVLVAPWIHLKQEKIEEEGEDVVEIARPWMETPIDFKKIKNFTKYVCISSDNDPFVPLSEADIFKKELGAKIIVKKGKGHFAMDDNCYELPDVLEEILSI